MDSETKKLVPDSILDLPCPCCGVGDVVVIFFLWPAVVDQGVERRETKKASTDSERAGWWEAPKLRSSYAKQVPNLLPDLTVMY